MQISELCPTPEVFSRVNRGHVIPSYKLPKKLEDALDGWMEMLQSAFDECSSGRTSVDLAKLPIERKRLLAAQANMVIAHHANALQRGMPGALLSGNADALRKIGLNATVTTADIATFTTQQLAFVVDVFAPWDTIYDAITTIAMTGPTAFVHRQTLSQESSSDFYSAGMALVNGLDPSYSECPTECNAANGIDVEVDSELVEADCRRLKGTWCYPANWHYSSQYGGDLGRVLMDGMTIEFRRHIQADILAMILANAAETIQWNRTPGAGTYYETANPREWTRTLYERLLQANRDIMLAPEGRVSATHILGDVEAIGVLEGLSDFEFIDQTPGNNANAVINEVTSYAGTLKAPRWRVLRFLEGLAENNLIILNRNDNDPTHVYAPWIPITMLETLTEPDLAKVRMGGITLYGQKTIRPDRIRHIALGA